jgi:hypothetical protein
MNGLAAFRARRRFVVGGPNTAALLLAIRVRQ